MKESELTCLSTDGINAKAVWAYATAMASTPLDTCGGECDTVHAMRHDGVVV